MLYLGHYIEKFSNENLVAKMVDDECDQILQNGGSKECVRLNHGGVEIREDSLSVIGEEDMWSMRVSSIEEWSASGEEYLIKSFPTSGKMKSRNRSNPTIEEGIDRNRKMFSWRTTSLDIKNLFVLNVIEFVTFDAWWISKKNTFYGP